MDRDLISAVGVNRKQCHGENPRRAALKLGVGLVEMEISFHGSSHSCASGRKRQWLRLFKEINNSKIALQIYAEGASEWYSIPLEPWTPFPSSSYPINSVRLCLIGAWRKPQAALLQSEAAKPLITFHPLSPRDRHSCTRSHLQRNHLAELGWEGMTAHRSFHPYSHQ